MTFSNNCISLIKFSEGFKSSPYPDENQVPTIGYGSTYYEDGTKVTLHDPPITKDRAAELLLFHLNKIVLPIVQKVIHVPLSQNQLDALGSLIYNIGGGAFASSSLAKAINAKGYLDTIKPHWLQWHFDNHKSIPGLVTRRQNEWNLFCKI